MVAAEFLTGLGALKTAFDMTKALQNVHGASNASAPQCGTKPFPRLRLAAP